MTTTLETAEKVVANLSPDELAQFRQWFAEFDGEIWDAQIESDAASGKMDALAEEALTVNRERVYNEAMSRIL